METLGKDACPTYNVHKVQNTLEIQDPNTAGIRYHTVIFVETDTAEGSGYFHHVTGDFVTGMKYESRFSKRPEDSDSFYQKLALGTVDAARYPGNVNSVCEKEPAPPKQKAFNVETMRTEPIKADGSFYRPGEARRPLVKCTEWVEHQAIPALRKSGVLYVFDGLHTY